MARKGGYKIIDLKRIPITTNESVTIKGVYKMIKSTNKATLVSGAVVDGVSIDDFYALFEMSGNKFIGIEGDNQITISPDDKLLWEVYAPSGVELEPGDNIQIVGNVISATDTTYSAGDGININNNVISTQTYSAGNGIEISDDGSISLTEPSYIVDFHELLPNKYVNIVPLRSSPYNVEFSLTLSDETYNNIVKHKGNIIFRNLYYLTDAKPKDTTQPLHDIQPHIYIDDTDEETGTVGQNIINGYLGYISYYHYTFTIYTQNKTITFARKYSASDVNVIVGTIPSGTFNITRMNRSKGSSDYVSYATPISTNNTNIEVVNINTDKLPGWQFNATDSKVKLTAGDNVTITEETDTTDTYNPVTTYTISASGGGGSAEIPTIDLSDYNIYINMTDNNYVISQDLIDIINGNDIIKLKGCKYYRDSVLIYTLPDIIAVRDVTTSYTSSSGSNNRFNLLFDYRTYDTSLAKYTEDITEAYVTITGTTLTTNYRIINVNNNLINNSGNVKVLNKINRTINSQLNINAGDGINVDIDNGDVTISAIGNNYNLHNLTSNVLSVKLNSFDSVKDNETLISIFGKGGNYIDRVNLQLEDDYGSSVKGICDLVSYSEDTSSDTNNYYYHLFNLNNELYTSTLQINYEDISKSTISDAYLTISKLTDTLTYISNVYTSWNSELDLTINQEYDAIDNPSVETFLQSNMNTIAKMKLNLTMEDGTVYNDVYLTLTPSSRYSEKADGTNLYYLHSYYTFNFKGHLYSMEVKTGAIGVSISSRTITITAL